MKKRLFIGNLPETITESDLLKKISTYGNVDSIELKEKPSGKFAFVDFIPKENNIHDVLHQISNTQIKGNYLTVQLAKESFLSKLERERKEKQNSTKQSEENANQNDENKHHDDDRPMFRGTLFYQNKDNDIKQKEKNENVESLLKLDNDKFEKNNEINYKQEKKRKRENESFLKSDDKEKWNDDTGETENEINNTTFKKKHIEEINSSNFQLTDKKIKNKKLKQNSLCENSYENQNIADLKRQNALNEKAKEYQNRKNILKQALYNIDSINNSNKIIFDSDNEEEINEKNVTFPKKDLLFEGDEEDDDKDDFKRFEIKSQFKGEKGQKLLELQSRYNNDSRFTLDERFQQDDDNIADEGENKIKSQIPKSLLLQRFDPTKSEHEENFISKVSEEEKDENLEKKKEKKKNDKVKKKQKTVTPVPIERFYQVDGLKNSLNKKEENFSLLQMFGNENNIEKKEDNKQTDESIHKKKFTKLRDFATNPFKYDSSDDEFNEIDSQNDNQVRQYNEIKPVINNTTGPTIALGIRRDIFFLSPDDSRFGEGWRCIINNTSSSFRKNDEEFATWRRTIRGAIRLKRKTAEQKETKQNNKKTKYNTKKRPQNKKNGIINKKRRY